MYLLAGTYRGWVPANIRKLLVNRKKVRMPSKFSIIRTISRGKPGRAEIIVNFHGKSVTRHTRNGIGRHPDDTIPALHSRLEERLADNISLRGQKVVAQGVLAEKKPEGYLDYISRLQREISVLDAAKPVIESALASVRKEDPLMVAYVD